MRILFLNPVGEIGGAERALLTAVASIRQTRPAATIKLIAGADGPLVAEVRRLGAEAEVVPIPAALQAVGDSARNKSPRNTGLRRLGSTFGAAPAAWRFAQALKARIADFRPTIVHSNGIKCHILTRLVVPRGAPVIWWAQDFYSRRRVAGRLLRWARRRCNLVLAISQAVADDVRQTLPGTATFVLYHAVDTARFCPGVGDVAAFDQAGQFAPAEVEVVRVGLVATYARWKGQLTLLDAAAKLRERPPQTIVRWYIVGGPIYFTEAQFSEAELREEAAKRGLTGEVGFVPFTAEPVESYRALDVVIHGSTSPEPFGLVIAEAMSTGRAVIVSAAGGAAELFADGQDALGIVPGSAEQLAEAVRRLADDRALRDRLGEAARRTVLERFDAASYGERLCAAYDAVVAGRPPSSA